MIRVLGNRNFLFLFLGRIFTNVADSIYYVAAMWIVYELGGSAFYTGLAGFLVLIPQALQFLTGPIIDRISIRKILTISQVLQAILIVSIPTAYWLELLSISFVLIVMPIISLLNQFVYPATNAIIPVIIPKNQYTKGNALMSIAYQGVDMVFNAISGILISIYGAVTLFWTDSFIFFLAALMFWKLSIPDSKHRENTPHKFSIKKEANKYFEDLKMGFKLVIHSPIVTMFGENIIANFALGMMMAILPVYADYRGGAAMYGFFLASFSCGMLVGSFLATLAEKAPLGKVTMISFAFGACSWILSAMIGINSISILLFGISAIPLGLTNVLFFTMLQKVVPEQFLARVFSVIVSISSCAMPIGSLIGGALTTIYSSVVIFIATGFGILFISIYIFLVPVLRNMPSVTNASVDYFGFDGEGLKKEGIHS